MELVSYLNSEIERKRIEHLEEIELLNALFEEIERKENFAKVWFTLVKCGITDDNFIKDLVSFYFNIDSNFAYDSNKPFDIFRFKIK